MSSRAEDLPWLGPVAVVAVMPDLTLELQDGRMLRLAGLDFPRATAQVPDEVQAGGWTPLLPAARATIERWLDGRALLLRHSAAPFDRAGRLVAMVKGVDGAWLQEMLLGEGQAMLRPGLGLDLALAPEAERLRAAEAGARAGGRGLWGMAEMAPRAAGRAGELVGRFGIVRGRVLHAQRARAYVYLNFGRSWREDMTVRATLDKADALERQGLDLVGLEGKEVEVRGWIFEERGPMIEIEDRWDLEVLR